MSAEIEDLSGTDAGLGAPSAPRVRDQTGAGADGRLRVYSRRGAWVVLLAFALGGLVIDLASKAYAFAHVAGAPVEVRRADVLEITARDAHRLSLLIPAHPPVVVVPKVLDFTLVLNPGAVFGIGAGARFFFIAFTAVAIGFSLFMFHRWTRPRDFAAHAALGLLISGGLGNLYDRLLFGCVRDFIHPVPGMMLPFGWSLMGSREVWPWVSNLADLFLIIGIGMLVWYLMREPARAGAEARAREGAAC
ncbi:hypothetical protein BH11PLA1_BH11PLA1_05490 [soil metagenome]